MLHTAPEYATMTTVGFVHPKTGQYGTDSRTRTEVA